MQAQAATFVPSTARASMTSGPSSLDLLSPETVHCGCGYFDSSYELSRGLQVTEELDPTLAQLWARVLHCALEVH